LRMILNAQPDMQVVATAGDGREAITQAERMTPDVVIMDISMPGLNGLAATVQLTEKCPAAKVLTLTRHADSSYLHQLMRAGAAGYVLKQSRPAELLHAIRSVATGSKYLDSSMTPPVVGKAAATPGPEPTTPLSPRETEVLRLIAWGNTNKEIASRLDLRNSTCAAASTSCATPCFKAGCTSLERVQPGYSSYSSEPCTHMNPCASMRSAGRRSC
jgi:two-component system, NarL family, response regulator NreC